MDKNLVIKDLYAFYGKKTILKGINAEVKSGEVCCILGLNGSGKSTLINSVLGFVPHSGGVFVGNTDCDKLNEKQKAFLISYIPQSTSLKDGKTALDAVLMGYNPYISVFSSVTKQQTNSALAVLEEMGIREKADDDISTLSGGQKQLCLIARCLVQNTPVMLLDEPDNSLDFKNRHTFFAKIRETVKKYNKACLVSLHDPAFALGYADKIFVLNNGIISDVLDVKIESTEHIQSVLSSIYGSIEIIKTQFGYGVLKNE